MAEPIASRRVAMAAAIDVVSILLFVVIGRRSHDEGGSVVVEAAKVAAPFLIALGLGWLAARAWASPTAPVPTGIIIWLVTVAAGMLLRRFVFDGGTALPFIIVASLFTLLFLVGWRVVHEWRGERRARTA